MSATVARRVNAGQDQRSQASATLAHGEDPLRISLFLLTIVTISRDPPALEIHRGAPPGAGAGLLDRRVRLPQSATDRAARTASTPGPRRSRSPSESSPVFRHRSGCRSAAAPMYILTEYSKTLVFAFLLFAAIRTASDLYTLAWAYVISSAILVWMALFLFGLSHASNSAVERLSNLYTWDANDIGVVLIVGLALTLLDLPDHFRQGEDRCRRDHRRYRRHHRPVRLAGHVRRRAGLRVRAAVHAESGRHREAAGLRGCIVLGLIIEAPHGYWEQMSTIAAPKAGLQLDRQGRPQGSRRAGLGLHAELPDLRTGDPQLLAGRVPGR